jgi:hypothetical protein
MTSLKLALSPMYLAENAFVEGFSEGLHKHGFVTREFQLSRIFSNDIVIYHWPNKFFVTSGIIDSIKSHARLLLLAISRRLGGLKVVWVVHNALPHDSGKLNLRLAKWFIGELDATINLTAETGMILSRTFGQSITGVNL